MADPSASLPRKHTKLHDGAMRLYRVPLANPTSGVPSHFPGSIGARYVSFAIAATALYGDLLKRILPSTAALMVLYAISVCIILVMFATGRRCTSSSPFVMPTLATLLMSIYFLQFGIGFDAELLPAAMMLIYVCVPLLFIVIIPQAYTQFDIQSLAFFVAVLMVPIHAVGLVQHYIDPSFLISTTYSESGGVIYRNFLEGFGRFTRVPSIFASADRYAGITSAQIVLSIILVGTLSWRNRRLSYVVVVSMLPAVGGLMVAGARSRILSIGCMLLACGVASLFSRSQSRASSFVRSMVIRTALASTVLLALAILIPKTLERVIDLPVATLLAQTATRGDVQARFQEGIDVSSMPEDIKFFGEGLGTSDNGRPGEFGVRAMWIEGGLFWTSIMLIVHAGILIWFAANAFRAITSGYVIPSAVLTFAGITWFYGLIAGLSATFELSFALLLFPMIAVAVMARGRSVAKGVFGPRQMQISDKGCVGSAEIRSPIGGHFRSRPR